MAFALAIRRFSLLDMNHRFLRTALRIPALDTSLRHRLTSASCDSPARRVTDTKHTSHLHQISIPSQHTPDNARTRLVLPSRHRRAQQPSPRFTQASHEALYDSIQGISRSLPTRNGLQEPVSATSATNTCTGALRDIVPYRPGAPPSTAAPLPLSHSGRGHMDFVHSIRPALPTGPETWMTDNAALYVTIIHQLTKQCQVDLRARAVNRQLAIPQNRAEFGVATSG